MRTFFLSGAAIAVLTSCASETIPPAATSPQIVLSNDWQTLDTVAYRGKRDDISFSTPTHGWYGTGKGDLYATTDGGNSWQRVASKPGTFIRALGFIDENTGFIGNVGTDYYPGVTDETPLYRTDDGGVNWTPVELGGKTIKGVCAIDILESTRIYQGKLQPRTVIHAAGRVGGPTGIIRSVDNGKTWSVIDMQAQAGMILDVKFFDEMTGLVFASSSRGADNEGLVLRTEDGGQTWTEVYKSGRNSELIWKASFPDNKTGYATVQSYDKERAQQLIIKTTDGGKSWRELPLTENAGARQFGIGFLDAKRGWVGTFAGGFYTDDGGETFQPVPIAPGANKFRVVRNGAETQVFAIGTKVQKLDIEQGNPSSG
ncbi:MAG: YCF48-related protein [Parasphingorhabdus sp.]